MLDEEVLLEWAKKPSKKYVSRELSEEMHTRAAPFITWLREAEEETSSDSDEDDVEVRRGGPEGLRGVRDPGGFGMVVA